MPSRRDLIRMSDAEVDAFLAQGRIVTCATVGPNGRPHLMPLWYIPDGTELRAWTFAKSQKARNLERLPQATLQVEAGEAYEELRGVMLECEVELARDADQVTQLGLELTRRYAAGGSEEEVEAGVRAQAPKRVGLRFMPTKTVSWDHRKLGATY